MVGKVRARRLLEPLPGIGSVRARQLLADRVISESRRVQGLAPPSAPGYSRSSRTRTDPAGPRQATAGPSAVPCRQTPQALTRQAAHASSVGKAVFSSNSASFWRQW
ncbi:hypothetical protein [Streptomyces decoyicus]|uniref:hypothetical protein n=1 Tax=Streptomyces decoyicus TaxID=249567 RepID=UPI00364CB3A9